MNLEELAKHDHPYYGSGSHEENYDSFQQFFDDMIGYDVDLNLCYRWDVKKSDDGTYYAELFTLLQRKGRITAHRIEKIVESDIPLLEQYLKPHMDKLREIWLPFKF